MIDRHTNRHSDKQTDMTDTEKSKKEQKRNLINYLAKKVFVQQPSEKYTFFHISLDSLKHPEMKCHEFGVLSNRVKSVSPHLSAEIFPNKGGSKDLDL